MQLGLQLADIGASASLSSFEKWVQQRMLEKYYHVRPKTESHSDTTAQWDEEILVNRAVDYYFIRQQGQKRGETLLVVVSTSLGKLKATQPPS